MAEEIITLDQAADQIIAGVRARANLPDTSERGVHRAAESEAWANAQIAKADRDEQAEASWSAIAGKIADKYQQAVREAKSKT